MQLEQSVQEASYPLRHDIDLHLTVMAVRRLPFIANLSEVDRAMLSTVVSELGSNILKYAERADNGAIDASEQQGQCNKQQYHACIQCEQCGEELYFRHPAHPAVQRSGEIEKQERDECKEYNCKCQSDST